MTKTYSVISSGRQVQPRNIFSSFFFSFLFFSFFRVGPPTSRQRDVAVATPRTVWCRDNRSVNIQNGPVIGFLRRIQLSTYTLYISGNKSRHKSLPSICQGRLSFKQPWPITCRCRILGRSLTLFSSMFPPWLRSLPKYCKWRITRLVFQGKRELHTHWALAQVMMSTGNNGILLPHKSEHTVPTWLLLTTFICLKNGAGSQKNHLKKGL